MHVRLSSKCLEMYERDLINYIFIQTSPPPPEWWDTDGGISVVGMKGICGEVCVRRWMLCVQPGGMYLEVRTTRQCMYTANRKGNFLEIWSSIVTMLKSPFSVSFCLMPSRRLMYVKGHVRNMLSCSAVWISFSFPSACLSKFGSLSPPNLKQSWKLVFLFMHRLFSFDSL